MSIHISVTNRWNDLLNYAVAPVYTNTGVDVLTLRPVQAFFDLVEPYSLVILISCHVVALVLSRNSILRTLVDTLTGDVLGPGIKTYISRSLESLIPNQVYGKMSRAYRTYSLFLYQYRP